MSYMQKWELAINQANIVLVEMAMVDVALELMADPSTDARIVTYATSCLNSPQGYAKQLTKGVVFVAAGTDDAAVRAAVVQVFPAYAGVQAT